MHQRSFCGALDWAVNPNKTTVLGPECWGALALKNEFDANKIKYNIYVNVYGSHVFQTFSFNQNWMGLSGIRATFDDKISAEKVAAYTKANVTQLLMYQYENTQFHEAIKMIATSFDNTVKNTLPAICSVSYIEPKCIQNTIFYQYSIGKMTIGNATNAYYQKPCTKR